MVTFAFERMKTEMSLGYSTANLGKAGLAEFVEEGTTPMGLSTRDLISFNGLKFCSYAWVPDLDTWGCDVPLMGRLCSLVSNSSSFPSSHFCLGLVLSFLLKASLTLLLHHKPNSLPPQERLQRQLHPKISASTIPRSPLPHPISHIPLGPSGHNPCFSSTKATVGKWTWVSVSCSSNT
jgi:hypothetical protein